MDYGLIVVLLNYTIPPSLTQLRYLATLQLPPSPPSPYGRGRGGGNNKEESQMFFQNSKQHLPSLIACVFSACASVTPLPGGLVPSTMPTDGTGLREFTVSGTLARGEACAESFLFITLESDAGLYLAKKRALQEAEADFLLDVTVDIHSLNVLYVYSRICTVVQGRGAHYPRAARQSSSSPPASGSGSQHLSARPPATSEVDARLEPLRDRLVGCRNNFAPKAYRAIITLTIEPSGRTAINEVQPVQYEGDSGDSKFAECVKMVLKPLRLPAFRGETTVMQTMVNL